MSGLGFLDNENANFEHYGPLSMLQYNLKKTTANENVVAYIEKTILSVYKIYNNNNFSN